MSSFNKVTVPSDVSLYKFEVESPPLFTFVGSSATKNPKSEVFVETSPASALKGVKSNVEEKSELKSFFEGSCRHC